MKLLDVSAKIQKKDRMEYLEPKIDERGRVVLMNGEAKFSHHLLETDQPKMIGISIGKAISFALDQNPPEGGEKLTAEERRKRFTLACKIESAMQDGKPFEMEVEDERRILAAADLITSNNLLLGRIYEAVEDAEKPQRKLEEVKKKA